MILNGKFEIVHFGVFSDFLFFQWDRWFFFLAIWMSNAISIVPIRSSHHFYFIAGWFVYLNKLEFFEFIVWYLFWWNSSFDKYFLIFHFDQEGFFHEDQVIFSNCRTLDFVSLLIHSIFMSILLKIFIVLKWSYHREFIGTLLQCKFFVQCFP